MPTPDSQHTCRDWLIKMGQRDSFIGRQDQTLLIDERLDELTDNLQRLETDISTRIHRLMDEVNDNFTKQAATIEETMERLQASFDNLALTPQKAAANKQLSFTLHHQVNLLSRSFRPRMLRALDRLSPKYQTLEKPLSELNNFRRNAAKPMPDNLWLLQARNKKVSFEHGKSLLELEFMPQMNHLCRLPLLGSLRFNILRLRCTRRYRFQKLPFQSIILNCLIRNSELNTPAMLRQHETIHDELQNMLSDVWRGIRYNLETAATELEDISDILNSGRTNEASERPEELRTIVFDALNKCLETFNHITVSYTDFLGTIIENISLDHQRALNSINRNIVDSRNLRMRIISVIKTTIRTWPRKIIAFKNTSIEKLTAINQAPAKLAERALWAFTLINFFKRKHPAEESLLQLTDLPTESELLEHSKILPPIYRRLFQNEPLFNREFLVGMTEEMNLLTETYSRWQSGRASSVAIVGPEGSGKTSLLNCFEIEMENDVKISRFELAHRMRSTADVLRMLEDVFDIPEPSATAVELIGKIQKLERQIVIFENGHQLYLRTVGAREALETFFYILINTRTNLFWLLSFRLHPWTRMGYIHQIDRFFTHVIKTEFHNMLELKTALLLRQRATGQEPLFDETGVSSYRLRKLLLQHQAYEPPVQQALEEFYFSNLFDLTGGNMESALFYWLRSLQLSENNTISVKPCHKMDNGFIKNLSSINLLSLAEVLAHGGLSVKEYGDIFNIDELRSRLVLDYLRQIRILKGHNKDKHGQPQFYTINPLFYQPISTVLNAAHIIY